MLHELDVDVNERYSVGVPVDQVPDASDMYRQAHVAPRSELPTVARTHFKRRDRLERAVASDLGEVLLRALVLLVGERYGRVLGDGMGSGDSELSETAAG